jgi:hypothetical protein
LCFHKVNEDIIREGYRLRVYETAVLRRIFSNEKEEGSG